MDFYPCLGPSCGDRGTKSSCITTDFRTNGLSRNWRSIILPWLGLGSKSEVEIHR